MSWLGQIRSHRRDETWSVSLWQTFFSTSMGAQIPVIPEKPLATCGRRKFQLDPLGDHLNTCTSHSGDKKTHDWMVGQIADLFRTPLPPRSVLYTVKRKSRSGGLAARAVQLDDTKRNMDTSPGSF